MQIKRAGHQAKAIRVKEIHVIFMPSFKIFGLSLSTEERRLSDSVSYLVQEKNSDRMLLSSTTIWKSMEVRCEVII